MNERRDVRVDLTNCDREPIHIPGAIQPHGVLLALQEPDLTILQASDNARAFFSEDAARVAGRPLSEVLTADGLAAIGEALRRDRLVEANPVRIVLGGRECDAVLHRHQGMLILEIETLTADGTDDRTHHPLRRVVSRLQGATTVAELLQASADAVQQLTGFERVLVYSFDEDGHGSVEAEVRHEGLDSYLGLHYPASDIPRQARELYLRNTIRIIPDARYTPVPLTPRLRPDTGAPLELSLATLRSVSPVHLEYLANMGVRASMSLSLVVRDGLWGLISCANHSGPRHVPYEVRSDCEVVARMTSLLIGAFQDRETAAGRERRRPALKALAAHMRAADDALAGLLAEPRTLLTLLGVDGAAVVGDGVRTAGDAPPAEAIEALSDWLEARTAHVFVTDGLTEAAPEFGSIKDDASGIVSFGLPGAVPRRLIGFRREILHAVDWGGDPRKPVEADGTAALHPRRSFALWREEVRLRSRPWSTSDREAAEELRRVVVEIDLEKQVEREQRAVKARDDLVAVVSHDLKNPLNVIQLQSVLLRNLAGLSADDRATRFRASVDRIQRSVGHMDALIHDLLDLARIEAGRFSVVRQPESLDEILEEALILLRPLAEAKHLALDEESSGDAMVLADRERIFQVLSNLVGNAIKFTPAGGSIVLRASVEGDHAIVAVSDTGPGLSPEQLTQVFNRYWQAAATAREGTGLGLYIAKGIVQAHGGRIRAESPADGGATFTFTVPLATPVLPA